MSQQQKSPHEDFVMAGLLFIVVGGLAYLVWKFFSQELLAMLRWVRVGELYLVEWIHGKDMRVTTPSGQRTLKQLRDALMGIPMSHLTSTHLSVATAATVFHLRYLFLGAIALMGALIFWKGPGTGYRRRMGLESLMAEQAKSFPVIHPFLKFDPRKSPARAPGQPVPVNLPLFAEALSPEEWLAYHGVTYENGRLDADAAFYGLVEQLGRRWQGPLKLPVYAQGLFAAFALKHARKRKESAALLNAMALSWSAEKGFKPDAQLVGKIRAVIRDPKLGGALVKYADMHAYETTALLRCLSRAREEGGVLAPAEFLWLRGLNRTLWYPLNNLGRKSYHAEAAGAMVHYTNELIAGQKIPTPRFDEVITGIEAYLKSGAARSIPQVEQNRGPRKMRARHSG